MGQKTSSRELSPGRRLLASSTDVGLDRDLDSIEIGEPEYDFEIRRISSWGGPEIEEWLKRIGFGGISRELAASFSTGAEFLELDFENPIVSSLSDNESRRFKAYVCHLRECVRSGEEGSEESNFKMEFHRVLQKIVPVISGDPVPYRQLEMHARVLSDWRLVQEHLLPLTSPDDWISSTDQQPPSIRASVVLLESFFDPKSQLLKAKGFLTPSHPRIVPSFPPDFGRFRAAVCIGPFFLQWTDSGLLIPLSLENEEASPLGILRDTLPMRLTCSLDVDRARTSLAKVIERWNTERMYSDRPQMRNEGNCLDFVSEVCRSLGIEEGIESSEGLKDDQSTYSKFLQQMKKSGFAGLEISLSALFMTTFKLRDWDEFCDFEIVELLPDDVEELIKGKKTKKKKDHYSAATAEDDVVVRVRFETHSQLDDFLFWCYRADPMAIGDFGDVYRVLKAFDRAFWMRAMKEPEDERWMAAPADEHDQQRHFGQHSSFVTGCPFADPRSAA